ncbi:MAG: hybrid sensor histidine kinase/response regulator, partial [Dysgonamonadaceae bacterium]|nr:hybrid sensor histidine kinase/response regulator [Dysgonamonadaceae bacterium]
MKNRFLCMLMVYNCLSSFGVSADNFRQISSKDGLSNSSVCCVLQDDRRFLWLGTYDGLNMYDGNNIHIYKPEINNPKSLSSNVIRNIIETNGNCLWISTKWGLNKLSKQTNAVEAVYPEFRDDSYSVKDRSEHLFIIGKKGFLSFYDATDNRFIDLPVNPEMTCEGIQNVVIDANDTIWINCKGRLEKYTVSFDDARHPQITRHPDFRHPCAVLYLSQSGGTLLLVDAEGNVYCMTPQNRTCLRNISRLIQDYGMISSLLLDDTDLLIGFKTNGVFRFLAKNHYQTGEKLDINCGVFSIKKDEAQDIIWIGTDGQGVYAWIKDDYKFGNLNLMQLPILKQRPVRAVYTDRHDNLWLGTKDNGVIRITNYQTTQSYTMQNVTHFTTENGLNNNEVFVFNYSSRHDVLWIGSNGPGMNYYSFRDGKMHSLINYTENAIQDVHALLNIRDSLLLIGAGNRLLKARIESVGNQLITKNVEQFVFNVKYKQRHNQIYALCPENDSILWIGVRGNGVVRFNLK